MNEKKLHVKKNANAKHSAFPTNPSIPMLCYAMLCSGIDCVALELDWIVRLKGIVVGLILIVGGAYLEKKVVKSEEN